jgi:mRNA interferase HigB
MHVISKKALRAFWAVHSDAERPLRRWFKIAQAAVWQSFADVRAVYPNADQVGRFTVFNVGGNKYRLITAIHYNRDKVYVRHVLTGWKEG